jgi:hypothetical protein
MRRVPDVRGHVAIIIETHKACLNVKVGPSTHMPSGPHLVRVRLHCMYLFSAAWTGRLCGTWGT